MSRIKLQQRLNPFYKIALNYLDINCTGVENINTEKNYIFAMNHQSIGDVVPAFAILVPATGRKLILFISHRFYKAMLAITLPFGAISVNMNKNDKEAKMYNKLQLLKGVHKLKKGHNVFICPEGIIRGGEKGVVIRGESGIIRLALLSKTPIIPIGIRGTNKAYPFLLETKNPFKIRKEVPIHMNIGKEIDLSEHHDMDLKTFSEENRNTIRKLTDELMLELSNLSGLPYDETA
ncbi:lysophospholipid acyltransferase family protein [Patescibacteria group bacterium]